MIDEKENSSLKYILQILQLIKTSYEEQLKKADQLIQQGLDQKKQN